MDYKRRFIDIEAGWPGSVGDRRIWKNSALYQDYKTWLSQFPPIPVATGELDGVLIEEDVTPFILADSAYPNTSNMVTTFKTTEITMDPVVGALNKKLGGARYHVECAFGILKARFQIFQRPLECAASDVRFAVYLTCAIFVLHNFLIDVRDEITREIAETHAENLIIDGEGEDEAAAINGGDQDEDSEVRNVLIRHMAWIMDEYDR